MSPNNILAQLYISAAGDRGSLSPRDVIYYSRPCEGEKNVTEGDCKSCYYCSYTLWNNHELHTVRAGLSLSKSPLAIFYPETLGTFSPHAQPCFSRSSCLVAVIVSFQGRI